VPSQHVFLVTEDSSRLGLGLFGALLAVRCLSHLETGNTCPAVLELLPSTVDAIITYSILHYTLNLRVAGWEG
jgi:hypothetical protein